MNIDNLVKAVEHREETLKQIIDDFKEYDNKLINHIFNRGIQAGQEKFGRCIEHPNYFVSLFNLHTDIAKGYSYMILTDTWMRNNYGTNKRS